MKKLFAVFFIFIIYSFCLTQDDKFNKFCKTFNIESVIVYSNLNLHDNSFVSKNNSANFLINNGINNVYKISTRNLFNNVCIENFSALEIFVDSSFSIEQIVCELKAYIVKVEKICDRKIVYAYSKYFQKKVISDGVCINFQICKSKDGLKIGYPLLLGSY